MINALTILLYGIAGAICWRFRGGALDGLLFKAFGFKLGDTFVRLISALLLALPVLHLNWQTAGLVWAATFGGMTIGYFKNSMSANNLRETLWMCLWGLCVVTCATFFLWPPEVIAFFGISAGPIYWATHRFEFNLPNVALPPFVGEGWSAWAELSFGFVVGVSMASALIW